ncbi:MAG: hypothetical protein ACE5Q6_07655 [Dehalococcoidia bacterium]
MVTAARKCAQPECGGTLVPEHGREGALVLLEILVDPNSAVRHMLQGAANRRINGQVQVCDTCGHIDIFRLPKRR